RAPQPRDGALAAGGKHIARAQRIIFDSQPLEQRVGFFDRSTIMSGGTEPAAADTLTLADRQCHVFDHAQPAEQGGDLKSANEAALDSRRLRQRGDISVAEEYLPGI